MYYESFPLSFDEGLRLLLGVGGGSPTPIYYIIISNNFGINVLDTVFYGVNLFKIHLFGLTFP